MKFALYDKALTAGRIGIHFGNPVDPDINADGAVDLADFAILAANFNTPGTFEQGDINLDGLISMNDFVAWRQAFSAAPAAVPEPSASLLALFGVFGLVLRRRRSA